ncbi:MAG: triose-phosphate isomerase [Eubacteriaceae bacterium]|nr:triose-phosphate isomerase [Eubacteriaceae bacterium]
MRIPFIAGNWKMNMSGRDAVEFAEQFKALYKNTDVRTAICAPYVHLELLVEAFDGTDIKVGAENAHWEDSGAYTGEVSVPMLEEIGVDYCIIGHSERRQYFNETDETVNLKLKKLFTSSILPILCVGEVLEEREAGKEKEIVGGQLKKDLEGLTADNVRKLVIAYEPVWAIGTGKTATPEQANEMCGFIRDVITDLYDEDVADEVIIQYGGSMNPENATELMNQPEIDGGLIGGASLSAEKFMKVIDF